MEKRTLLEKYRLKPSQLPRILITDPVARYYGLMHQQVYPETMSKDTM